MEYRVAFKNSLREYEPSDYQIKRKALKKSNKYLLREGGYEQIADMYRTQRALSPLEESNATPLYANHSVAVAGSEQKLPSPYSGQKYREAIEQYRKKIDGLSASVDLSPKAIRDGSP